MYVWNIELGKALKKRRDACYGWMTLSGRGMITGRPAHFQQSSAPGSLFPLRHFAHCWKNQGSGLSRLLIASGGNSLIEISNYFHLLLFLPLIHIHFRFFFSLCTYKVFFFCSFFYPNSSVLYPNSVYLTDS